eukprot:IDg21555t1
MSTGLLSRMHAACGIVQMRDCNGLLVRKEEEKFRRGRKKLVRLHEHAAAGSEQVHLARPRRRLQPGHVRLGRGHAHRPRKQQPVPGWQIGVCHRRAEQRRAHGCGVRGAGRHAGVDRATPPTSFGRTVLGDYEGWHSFLHRSIISWK